MCCCLHLSHKKTSLSLWFPMCQSVLGQLILYKCTMRLWAHIRNLFKCHNQQVENSDELNRFMLELQKKIIKVWGGVQKLNKCPFSSVFLEFSRILEFKIW